MDGAVVIEHHLVFSKYPALPSPFVEALRDEALLAALLIAKFAAEPVPTVTASNAGKVLPELVISNFPAFPFVAPSLLP